MKSVVLKFLLSALSAISLTSCEAQNKNRELDKLYYELITDIIFQDTLVSNWKTKIIEAKMKNGKLTRTDSIKYYKVIKNKSLLLYNRKTNSLGKRALLDDLDKGHVLASHFTENELKAIIDNFPEENSFHHSKIIPEKIGLIEDLPKWGVYHKFSSPVSIGENQFLIYHYTSAGRFNLKYGVIIFTLGDKGYTINEEITLKQIII